MDVSKESFYVCEKCQREIRIGDYPFCNGNPSDHGSVRNRKAEFGPPTIVYKNQKGDCWFPTGPESKAPKGYERHELKTQRDRDHFEREINAKETAKLHERIYRDRAEWESTYGQHSKSLEKAEQELRQAGYEPKLIHECLRDYKQRELEYDRKLRDEAGFHIESNHYYGRRIHEE
jgi:hypothetical protein